MRRKQQVELDPNEKEILAIQKKHKNTMFFSARVMRMTASKVRQAVLVSTGMLPLIQREAELGGSKITVRVGFVMGDIPHVEERHVEMVSRELRDLGYGVDYCPQVGTLDVSW